MGLGLATTRPLIERAWGTSIALLELIEVLPIVAGIFETAVDEDAIGEVEKLKLRSE